VPPLFSKKLALGLLEYARKCAVKTEASPDTVPADRVG
jgi:hypothetical protein